MTTRRATAYVILLAGLLAASSCKAKEATVVVGIESEPLGGAISRLHVVVKVGGVVARDETLVPSQRAPLDFPRPWETRLRAEREGDRVDVEIDGFDAVNTGAPLLRRLASTSFVPGREMLLRVRLESRCIAYPSAPRPPGSPPGPLNGPTCNAPETCIRGSCQSDLVSAARLEPFAQSWASHAPDLCKPAEGGPPSVRVGTGQTGFSSLTRGQVLKSEPGPQGGHHVWIAVQMQNMSQTHSTTRISAIQPDTGTAIPPSVFAFPFDPDQEGHCQLYGLRYQLDNDGIDYVQFLGKPLDVTVTVVDSAGARASSSERIQVSPDVLGEGPGAHAPPPGKARDR